MEQEKQLEIQNKTQSQIISNLTEIERESIENLFQQIKQQYPQFQNIEYFGKDQNNSLILSCFDKQLQLNVALRILRTQGNIWTKIYQEDWVIKIYELEKDIPHLLNIQQEQDNEQKEVALLIFEMRINKKLIQNNSKFYKMTDYLENPKQLKYLSDRNSDFQQIQGKLVAQVFQKCHQLFHLELYFAACSIQDSFPQQLIDQLSLNSSLRYLTVSFSFNQLDNQSGILLGKSLSKLQQLSKLELNYNSNQFEDSAAQSIGQGLAKLHNLESLILEAQNNKLTENGISHLVSQISQMKNLSILIIYFTANLNTNMINNCLLEFIPQCKRLVYFATQQNHLAFKGQYGIYDRRILKGKRLVHTYLQK